MSWFTERVLTAQRKGRCQDLTFLSREWNLMRKFIKKEKDFERRYGAADPATLCSTSTGTPAPAPATPPIFAVPSPSPAPSPVTVPPAGTPPAAGEYYGDKDAVWAGGEVTRRACEIQQSGAKGACKKFGYPWGMPAPPASIIDGGGVVAGPVAPAVPPAGSPESPGEYYADTDAVWAGGDVTRRACEIEQSGAKGACKKFGYPWGMPAPAASSAAAAADANGLPIANPLPPVAGGSYYYAPSNAPHIASTYPEFDLYGNPIEAGAEGEEAAEGESKGLSPLAIGGIAVAALLLLGGAAKRKRRAS